MRILGACSVRQRAPLFGLGFIFEARAGVRRAASLLTAVLLSGCYTSAAVVDLTTRHSPSVVTVQRSDDGGTLTTRLTYGALPSDVAMTAWMPDRHLRTGRVVTSHLSPAAAACQPILTTLVHAYDARIVEDGREAVALQGAQRVYARGPFPVRLADLTYRISLDPFACWLVARSSETESSNPAPTELVLVGRSDDLQSIPLPTEWGAQSWRRWLWLPAAPAIDVAGFVIVPLEWMVAVVRSWTTPSDRGPGAES